MKNLARSILFLFLISIFALAFASDLGPEASITSSPSKGSLSTVFTFDASQSVDSRGFGSTLEYRWNFNAGEESWTDWDDDATVTHQYTDDGTKQIEVEVRDADGYTDKAWSQVDVDNELSYETEFTVSPEEGDTETVFEFDIDTTASYGTDLDAFEYRWDFDDDGDFDTDYISSETIDHSYGDNGIYMPVLEVTAPDGTTTEIRGYEYDGALSGGRITVHSSDYPEASAKVWPSSGDENTRFYFSAEDSFNGDDEYRWDFEGDGIFDTDWSSEETADHKYSTPGTYEVILQVRNSDGLTDEARLSITIAEEGAAPDAQIRITSDTYLADKDVGTTATEFKFNASYSSDEEDYSSYLEVRWDYEGDGDFDTTWSTEKTAYHQFLAAGEYEVTLEVRDTAGNVSEASYDIRVVTNTAPYASITVDNDEATSGVEFSFDAGASSDDQYKSTYLEVRWDWEGDGSWDTSFSNDKTEEHYYDSSGTYDVIVQVKDPEGQTDESSVSVTVLSNTTPYAEFSVDPEEGTYSTKFTFDASTSYDGQTDFDDLWFRWDFNYNGNSDITYDTSWNHSDTTTHYYDSDDGTGYFTVRLEVKDEDGEVQEDVKTIYVHWASPYLDELRSRGIIKGYDDGMRPNQDITRAELVKIVVESLDENLYGMTYQGYFSDVSNTSWYWKYLERAYELGIVSGYDDGSFGPDASINRAEAMKIIINGFDIDTGGSHSGGVFDDISASAWYFKYVMTAYEESLVSGYGDGTFGPGNNMTRGEAAKVVWLAM